MSAIALEYVLQDKEHTCYDYCADYDTFEVESEGCKLYGLAAWPDSTYKGLRPCVILLHGYPGSLRNDDLGYALCRTGCVVITPHHRGAWGSEGKYLPSNCVQDAINIAEYLRTSAWAKEHRIDPDKIFLAGHSMGGNTTLQAGRKLPWLKGLLLLTPYDPTREVRDGHPEALEELLPQCKVLHCDGVDAIRADIYGHLGEYAFERAALDLTEQNIFCCSGNDDPCAPPLRMVTPLENALKEYPSTSIRRFVTLPESHGLIGGRTAMIKAATQFVNDVLERSAS